MAAKIAGSTFEGLFVKALHVGGPVADQLRAVGFDSNKLETTYTVEVWRAALDVARAHYYPKLSAERGDFELGIKLVEGYLDTIIGKVIGISLSFLKADTLCQRLPRFLKSGIEGNEKEPESVKVGDKHYRITMYGDGGVPWVTAGSVHRALSATGVQCTVDVVDFSPTSFSLEARWA